MKMINKGLGADYYRWDLGDSNVTNERHPIEYFHEQGEYIIELYIENWEYGCIDSITKLFVVHPIPFVQASADTLICIGDSTDVFGETLSELVSWYWKPARYVSDDSAQSTIAWPDTAKHMKVHIIDTNGCIGVDSVKITVQDTPNVDIFSDTTVIIGEVVVLNPLTDAELTYEWHPPGANQDFFLIARDIYGCFEKKFDFRINIDERCS